MKQVKSVLKIASDCSGMGSDKHAARSLGLDFKTIFESDCDHHCRQVLKMDGPPKHLLEHAGKGLASWLFKLSSSH